MPRLDIILEVLLAATLVVAQVLVLNNLGVPFAAITLFAGLGSYLAAASLMAGATPSLGILAFALVAFLLFHGLRRSLPNDRYLLLSLATIQIIRIFIGGASTWGGQLGTAIRWDLLPPYDAGPFVGLALLAFLGALALVRACEVSQFGFAVELTRLSRSDMRLRALLPVDRVALVVLGGATGLAGLVGMLSGFYRGRVSPDALSLDVAMTTLVATLVAGQKTWRVALVSVAFFAFPYVFSSVLGYQVEAMGHLREILWSGLILVFGPRLMKSERRLVPPGVPR